MGKPQAAIIFKSVMKIHDGNPYIHVSGARAAALKAGWKKPLPVETRTIVKN
jgi:hypothetical protein